MDLAELEELKDFNELDVLFKIIEKAESLKDITEKTIRGNKSAGVETRKFIQELRMLSEIMRDKIQHRRYNKDEGEDSRLFKEIEKEKKRIIEEEKRIQILEEKRKQKMDEKRQNR